MHLDCFYTYVYFLNYEDCFGDEVHQFRCLLTENILGDLHYLVAS